MAEAFIRIWDEGDKLAMTVLFVPVPENYYDALRSPAQKAATALTGIAVGDLGAELRKAGSE